MVMKELECESKTADEPSSYNSLKMRIFNTLFNTIFIPGLKLFSVVYNAVIINTLSWIVPSWISWNKYSESMLRSLERRILSVIKTPYKGFFVDIGPIVGPADKIWTISLNTESEKTPLVLLHGLGAGIALWCLNLDAFAATRPVYAIDLLGFGRSSRPQYSSDAVEAEQQMVRSIEEWRKELKLKEFILLGHSMGGFLGASYAISYPDRVKHLILADPWGFPERPAQYKQHVPLWIRTIAYVVKPFNPLAGIRVAGPLGPWIIGKLRPDISRKYASVLEDTNLITEYIYQCNSQYPSGEGAFHVMMSDFGWAKNPIVNRIDQLKEDVAITLLYGSRSWIDHSAGDIITEKRMNSFTKKQVITGAGHHVYADRAEAFNQLVLEACAYNDSMEPKQKAIDFPSKNASSERLAITESDEPESDSRH